MALPSRRLGRDPPSLKDDVADRTSSLQRRDLTRTAVAGVAPRESRSPEEVGVGPILPTSGDAAIRPLALKGRGARRCRTCRRYLRGGKDVHRDM